MPSAIEKEMKKRLQIAIMLVVVDFASAGAIVWLLVHLNSPWWGYVLTLVCVTIQRIIMVKNKR